MITIYDEMIELTDSDFEYIRSRLRLTVNFPQKAYDNVVALYERNIVLAEGSEDDRRKLTRLIAEQNCFDLGDDWGTKSTGISSVQSKDAIAFRSGPGKMDIWDWQNGTTRKVQVKAGDKPDYPNVTNQYFIQVLPVNHLATPPVEDDVDDEPVDDTVKLLLMQVVSKLSELIEVNKVQAITFQNGLNEVKAEITKGVKIRF